MHRGKAEELEYRRRYGAINASYAVQDVFDLIVELITNPDDSYHRQYLRGERDQDGGYILLEILAKRKGRSSVIRVTDHAEGIDNLRTKVQRVGDRTSGPGDRGFMSRGLKDIAALGHVTVETIYHDRYDRCEITPDFQYIPYEDTAGAAEMRQKLHIPDSGTRVTVELHPHISVPLIGSVREKLPWHYALRDIIGGDSEVYVSDGKRPHRIEWAAPRAETIFDGELEIPGWHTKAHFTLEKAVQPLLDPPDRRFRRSGVIVKGSRAVYECSFLDRALETDPAAESYFGRLVCDEIEGLAEAWDKRYQLGEPHDSDNPTLVFDPNRREGMVRSHPFVQALFAEPISIMRATFEAERKARQNRGHITSKQTAERLRRLGKEATRFVRDKLRDIADEPESVKARHAQQWADLGMTLMPLSARLAIGDERTFQVRASKAAVKNPTAEILVKLPEDCGVEVSSGPGPLEVDTVNDEVLVSSFALHGYRATPKPIEFQVSLTNGPSISGRVEVVGVPDIDAPDKLAFSKETYAIKQGTQKALHLTCKAASDVKVNYELSVEDHDVADFVSRTPMATLLPGDGATWYQAEVMVEGKQLGGETVITATIPESGETAQTTVKVVARDPDDPESISFELVPYGLGSYRAVWDTQGGRPNTLIISANHDSISRYLGPADQGWPGQHELPFRSMLAEIITHHICRRIVEERFRTMPHEFDAVDVYFAHGKLVRELAPIAHRALA